LNELILFGILTKAPEWIIPIFFIIFFIDALVQQTLQLFGGGIEGKKK